MPLPSALSLDKTSVDHGSLRYGRSEPTHGTDQRTNETAKVSGLGLLIDQSLISKLDYDYDYDYEHEHELLRAPCYNPLIMSQPFRAVIFALDGVLADSE